MSILATLLWIKNHWKTAIKSVLVASVVSLLFWGVSTHNKNIKLTHQLETAQNNIEAYQGLLDSSQQANNVLQLDFKDLKEQHDVTLHKLDSVRQKLDIKAKQVQTAATQTQTLNVKESKEIDSTLIKDNIYSDSIAFNDYTIAYYTVSPDTVTIGLQISNDKYLYVYSTREYKNKKSFIKRLFTFDFKKITKTRYKIYNTNDLIKSSDVRVVESTDK